MANPHSIASRISPQSEDPAEGPSAAPESSAADTEVSETGAPALCMPKAPGSGSAGGGAGQTYGASLGNGQAGRKEDSGGGGGGYYGGYGANHKNGGGGGGSGFVSGMSGCATVSGYAFQAASMQTGVRNGNGYATIILYSED